MNKGVRAKLLIFFVVAVFANCIGIDYLEDAIIGEKIEVTPTQIALQPGDTYQLTGIYFNKYGQKEEAILVWVSSVTNVATVDQRGLVTAHNPGIATITVSYQNIQSVTVNINVVATEDDVAVVMISTESETSIGIGQSIPLSASVKNINGNELPNRTIEWFSENATIAHINGEGEVTGVTGGVVDIHAKVESVKSNVITFTVNGDRQADFVSAGGYTTIGKAVLKVEEGELILEFSDDFETSFALGTFVYLANVTNGAQVKTSGLEIAQIADNGKKRFNIKDVDPSVGLYDYRYVIILCKPASVTFGYADLK